jgi:hypothetical protein
MEFHHRISDEDSADGVAVGMCPVLVELDDPQRFVGTVVLQERREPLRGRQVLEVSARSAVR